MGRLNASVSSLPFKPRHKFPQNCQAAINCPKRWATKTTSEICISWLGYIEGLSFRNPCLKFVFIFIPIVNTKTLLEKPTNSYLPRILGHVWQPLGVPNDSPTFVCWTHWQLSQDQWGWIIVTRRPDEQNTKYLVCQMFALLCMQTFSLLSTPTRKLSCPAIYESIVVTNEKENLNADNSRLSCVR